MAPLPSNNTGVLFLDYTVGGEGHTMQARYAASSTVVEVMTVLDEFLTALGDGIFTITVEGARHRLQGALITLPITWIGQPDYGSGTANHAQSAQYYDFVGRSVEGRKVRLSVFGAAAVTDLADDDYRLPGGTGAIAAAISALDSGLGAICAIDGENIVWYPYANTGINAYWRNKIR